MADFLMPSLGADMEDGTLVEWLVAPGDTVTKGQIVAVVETNKGAIEVEIFEDGVIRELVVPEDEKVPVGTVLARFDRPGEAAAEAPAASEPPVAAPAAPAKVPAPPPPVVAPPSTPGRVAASDGVRATPAARAAAAAAGVDLSTIAGTGPGGAVSLHDVEALTASAPAGEADDPQAAMMRAIAAAMSRSKREIPHYYLADDVDMKPALDWLAAHNADRPVEERVLPGTLLLWATAQACRRYPEFNGFWREGRHHPSERVHLGVAISLRGGGLVAPAIHDADQMSPPVLMEALTDVVTRARSGRLTAAEMRDATVTVTSLGSNGVPVVFPVIVPDQVAIVGFGTLAERPWVVDGAVVPRPLVTSTLGADHRVSNGHRGGLFLAAIGRLLQRPETA